MANFYDVNAAIDKPNVLGAMQQGLQFGQQQRVLQEQRADQQQLRSLAPKIIAGDPGATAQAAVIDPQAASQYQGAGDSIARRAEGLVRLLEDADKRDPREAQALWQAHGVPFARQFSQGTEPTTDWMQAKPMLANLKARIEMAKSAQQPSTTPTGFQELHMKALAAGLQPGSPEYQQAMNIALGREGRAATGGFGFEKVIGADGRERMGRTNPRTGVFEVYDEGSGNFVPMGGPAALNGGQMTQAPGYGAPEVGRADMERDIELANEMVAAGIPSQQIDAFLQARGARASGQQPQQASPALGVSQSPAERKFAEESGQQAAQLQFLPDQKRIERESAIEQARGIADVKREAELAEQAPKRVKQYEQALQASKNVMTSIDKALGMIGPLSTGFLGARSRGIEGSPAYNLAAEIETVKANLGFDRLQQMRDNSPTGGALGAIAVQELIALQSTIANLDPNQSDDQLRQNLGRVQTHYRNWQNAVQQALADENRQTAPVAPQQGRTALPPGFSWED